MTQRLTLRLRLAALCLVALPSALNWYSTSSGLAAAKPAIQQQAASFSGQLTTQHDTWNRMTTINVFSGQQVFFEVTHLRIVTSGPYTIDVNATGFTPTINVYGGTFFPATPQVNFWDNGVIGNGYQVFLAGGQQFDIVISTNLAGETGTYSAAISGPGPLTVDPPPPLGILNNPLDATLQPGQSTTLRVATQGRAPKAYQWFQGQSGDTAQLSAGATGTSFTTPALFADTSYWVRVSDSATSVDSGTATVFVTTGPITSGGVLTACDDRLGANGQGVPFKLFRFRVSTAGSYRFQLNTSGFNGQLLLYQGAFLPANTNVNFFGSSAVGTSVSLTSSLLADGNLMHLVIIPQSAANLGTFTVTATNGPALITKLPAPEITMQPLSANVTRGQTPVLSVGTNSLNVSYQWFSGTCQSRTKIAGATGASFTPPPLTRDQSYFVRLENPGGYLNSSIATLTVAPFAGNFNANPIAQGQPLNVSAPGVLSNATGPDGRPLNAFKDANPAHGTVTFNLNGSFSYQPALNYVGPDSFTFHVSDGVRSSASATVNITVMPTFANGTPNTIPAQGQANIYPSTITVSGLMGNITKLIVTLNPLRHENEGDLDILLVGPQGQALVLLSDANGDPDNPFVFDRSTTFDDAATDTIFDGRALFDGTYRPVNYGGGDSFPAPAP
ncbi:MAG: cadherin-like domain-containing protein, partial [Acidobacteria bacterium]|nr:cadherin-like domain-containing protein [Acidobacteriota bacterium]